MLIPNGHVNGQCCFEHVWTFDGLLVIPLHSLMLHFNRFHHILMYEWKGGRESEFNYDVLDMTLI